MFIKIKSTRGITLLELLIASVIALLVTGAALEVYLNQQKGWLAQENISDMQQNSRAAMEEIVFHLMQAGYNLPVGVEAILASNSNPDTITMVYASEPPCNASLLNAMATVHSELELDPDSVGCYHGDSWAYIHDPVTGEGEYFYISDVQQASGEIYHSTMPLTKVYPAGSNINVFEMATFYIDDTSDSLHPKLMLERMDGVPQIYADNIEDLQFTYTLAYGAVVDTLVTSSIVREVNIELVSRTDNLDPIQEDDYARDTLRTTVFVRNLSF